MVAKLEPYVIVFGNRLISSVQRLVMSCDIVYTLAQLAEAEGTPVYKFKRWRIKGQIIPEVFEQYKEVS